MVIIIVIIIIMTYEGMDRRQKLKMNLYSNLS